LTTPCDPPFAALAGADDGPAPSGRPPVAVFGCNFGSVCLLLDLATPCSRDGRRVSFEAFAADFTAARDFALFATLFFVVLETRLTAAPPVFVFLLGAAGRPARFTDTFFRELTFGFTLRFRRPEEADPLPAR